MLCLLDLDDPYCHRMTPRGFAALKHLFSAAKYVLWASQDGYAEQPYGNMMVGLVRTLCNELPNLSIQIVDFENGVLTVTFDQMALYLTETMLRMMLLDSSKLEDGILWSYEPEIRIRDGKLLLPRITPAEDLNNRLNSVQRTIEFHVDLKTSVVKVNETQNPSNRSISTPGLIADLNVPDGHVKIRVRYSSVRALRLIGDSFFYLCLGVEEVTGHQVIAVSPSNQSVIVVSTDWTIPFPANHEDAPQYLWTFGCTLLANSLLDAATAGSTSLVHNPDEYLQHALGRQSKRTGKSICFTRTQDGPDNYDSIVINPFASTRQLRSVLPQGLKTYFNLSDTSGLTKSVTTCYPDAVCYGSRWLFGNASDRCASHPAKIIREVLLSASTLVGPFSISSLPSPTWGYAAFPSEGSQTSNLEKKHLGFPDNSVVGVLDLSEINNMGGGPSTLISWDQNATVSVRLNPLDAAQMLSNKKTYFLVGLTGEVGQSISHWMVSQGVRHLVLASRSPKVDEGWLKDMNERGVEIRVFSMDVSDMSSVRGVVENVRETMPPIGGVANAAMVLSDQTLMEMDYDTFDRVTHPKVVGSDCLDQLFYSDQSLDFFIIFSSLASVVGNPGQANYNAANMYMASLARQRRRRGLAASVLDIGMVIGLGHLSKSNPRIEKHLRKMNFMPISERHLHTMFAEAIFAGKSDSEADAEIIVGLGSARTAKDQGNDLPTWYKDPRFSRLLNDHSAAPREISRSMNAPMSVTQLLSQTSTESEVCSVLEAAVSVRLGSQLQILPENINVQAPLTSLGIDSLIAVDVRMWLLATLKVDMPMFKLLSGLTVVQLCVEIMSCLNPELLPLLKNIMDPLVPATQSIHGGITTQESNHVASTKPFLASHSRSQTSSSADSKPGSVKVESQESLQDSNSSDLAYSSTSSTESTELLSRDDDPEELETTAIERYGPMSTGQGSIVFSQDYAKDKTMANIAIHFMLRGLLDLYAFEGAIKAVIRKHQILRTSFPLKEHSNTRCQVVLKDSPFTLQNMAPDADMALVHGNLMSTKFDLDRGHTLEAAISSRSPTIHHAIFCYHHIIMDGVSWKIFLEEVHQAYLAKTPDPCGFHQIDFALQESQMARDDAFKPAIDYWKQEFAEPLETIPLLSIAKVPCRRSLDTYQTNTVSLSLDANIAARIRATSKMMHITPFQFYLSTLQVLLFRLSGSEDQCIGVVDANRSDQAFANTIGYFINTLPVRFGINGSLSFEEVAARTRAKVHSALANANVPFTMLLEELKIPRPTTHAPLFQVLMNYRLGALEQERLGNCELTDMKGTIPKTPYDLTLLVVERSGRECLLQFDYQQYLYSEKDTYQLLRCYIHLLDTLSLSTASNVGDCKIFNPAMIEEGLAYASGNVSLELEGSVSLMAHIAARMREFPGDLAIKDGYGQTLSYHAVHGNVIALTASLSAMCLPPSSRIALFCEPSANAVCAMLAIWASGGTCVPLDLSNPVARLRNIMEECRPAVIVYHQHTLKKLADVVTEDVILLDIKDQKVFAPSEDTMQIEEAAKRCPTPHNPALILYTSGTTGRPKGVTLTHLNLLNTIEGIQRCLDLRKEVVLQQSSLGFDLSIAQILLALNGGGTLVIARREQRGDALELSRLMLSESVSFTFCVPSEYSILLRFARETLKSCTNWKIALSAGERFTTSLKRLFRDLESHVQPVNAYGPAETTVISHLAPIRYDSGLADESEMFLDVGRPLPNFTTYILDAAGKPLPLGFPGEIYIGGPSVSPGYCGNPNLTQQKFIRNPFMTAQDTKPGWELSLIHI